MSKRPLAALDFILFGTDELQEMPERIAHHILFAFVVIPVLLHPAENTGDIGRHRRFFGDDQRLHNKSLVQKLERQAFRAQPLFFFSINTACGF